ncbi:hypothetical protein GOP47_0012848 [Adiantum capillus-veneris]|uniref:Protein kinase domain-containing protein n=1 Tax=Adiantum capillus-veneris TaxID=13818 RepID=A0A9D4ZG33_ADICA|nr:hypothetical protein GOP47_0012848 [Adiantum capillus-veneris]
MVQYALFMAGLDYLHNGCNPPIIHRDVKSSNILLDIKFDAKISDFGISRNNILKTTGTTVLMGSHGYMDPEYVQTSQLTERVDIYSFGVLIFEVLSGKKAMFVDSLGKQIQLVHWVKPLIDCGSLKDLIDVKMGKNYNVSSVWHVIEVALACLQEKGEKRPTMNTVNLELKEAHRIEGESGASRLYDIPSMQLSGENFGTIHFTQVNTR